MGINLQPSGFSDDKTPKDYGEVRAGFKISSKVEVHPFTKIMKRVAKGSGIVSVEREWTLSIAHDGWACYPIYSLSDVVSAIDEISLKQDDRFLDTVLSQARDYKPMRLLPVYLNVRVHNEAVKNDIAAQAGWCGVDASIYVQLMILRRALRRLDYCREKHLRSIDYGKSEAPMREAVEDFEKWLVFRKTQLEFLLSKYGDSSETSHA